jgi:tRNA (cmo5U34)-methyltransferase
MPLERELESGKPWVFDAAVAESFDDMLDRSIPEIETMREVVTLAASFFFPRGNEVLDLGCSRGEALARLAALDGTDDFHFVGLEVSTPMLDAARTRFRDDRRISIYEQDLRHGILGVAPGRLSVALSVLTLMFVPVNYRRRLLREVYDRLAPRGGLVLVEKTIGDGVEIDDLMNANYHRRKFETGYTPDEIERKRLALEGVLVPLTARQNRELLLDVGFEEVDEVWSWFNFRAWVAVK